MYNGCIIGDFYNSSRFSSCLLLLRHCVHSFYSVSFDITLFKLANYVYLQLLLSIMLFKLSLKFEWEIQILLARGGAKHC